MELLQGIQGERSVASGVSGPLRLNPHSALVVAQGDGRYGELARLGQVFSLDSDSVTLAATHTTKSALGTATFINGFFNPPDSGVIAEILFVSLMVTSGTPTGGFVWNYFETNRVSSALTGTIRNGILGLAPAGSRMSPLVNVAIVTVPADTTNLIQSGVLGGPAAVAAGAGIYSVQDDIGGRIQVPPGVGLGLMQIGASTALVQSTITWREPRSFVINP